MTNTYPVPYKVIGDKKFFFLSVFGDTGNLRAATINKCRLIQDEDKHHCCEAENCSSWLTKTLYAQRFRRVNVQGSIRYVPKKWILQ